MVINCAWVFRVSLKFAALSSVVMDAFGQRCPRQPPAQPCVPHISMCSSNPASLMVSPDTPEVSGTETSLAMSFILAPQKIMVKKFVEGRGATLHMASTRQMQQISPMI